MSFQCRAREPFSKGELILVPGDAKIEWVLARSPEESAPESSEPKKKAIIHFAMVPQVRGIIQEVVKDGRRGIEPRPAKTFGLISPLVASPPKKGEETKTSKVHPFWTVVRCLNLKSVNNMKLFKEEYLIPQTLFKGCVKPNRNTVISLPVLRNIVAIEKNDILTVPYMRAADDDE